MTKSQQWLTEYNRTIGSSRAAAVLGKDPWKSAGQVYDEMFGDAKHPDLSDSPDVRRGIALEPIAIKELNRQAGLKLKRWPQNEFVYNEHLPFAHALPDAADKKGTLGEVKVPRPQTWQKMYLHGVPEHYQIQCQHMMAVTGTFVVHFAALCPVTMRILHVPIERNPEIIGEIIEGERRFIEAARRGIRPDDDVQADANFELPPLDGTLAIIDSGDAVRAAEAYLEAKALLDEAQEIVEQAKLQLLQSAPAEVSAFEVPGILRCYHKMQPGRQTFDYRTALAEHPELDKYMKTGKPFATFRAYPLKGG